MAKKSAKLVTSRLSTKSKNSSVPKKCKWQSSLCWVTLLRFSGLQCIYGTMTHYINCKYAVIGIDEIETATSWHTHRSTERSDNNDDNTNNIFVTPWRVSVFASVVQFAFFMHNFSASFHLQRYKQSKNTCTWCWLRSFNLWAGLSRLLLWGKWILLIHVGRI